ncbi:MAG: CRTAC1 family protein [Acidobacteria bacterium]|nr:CRTAC1 family protein [Acidobacteriota bacterium]
MPRVGFVDLPRACVLSVGLAVALAAAGPLGATFQPASEAGQPVLSDGHQRMLALLEEIADETPDTHPYIGDWRARQLREELNALPATDTGPNRWRVMVQLSGEELRVGNEAEAIRLLTDALELIPTTDENRPGITLNNYSLGVAYLRLAETRNCALHPNAEACILPLRGPGIHADQTPSRQAIAAFTEVLRNTADQASGGLSAGAGARNWSVGTPPPAGGGAAQQYLSALWLLNIAYMTVDGYPDEVPEAYRLPPETFQSAETIPRFANVAPALGLATFDMCGGAIADDFDNDGYLDIVVSTWGTRGQIRFFRNDQNGAFTERTAEAGLLGLYGGINMVQADYDNDGDVDLLVLRGAWLRADGRHPNSLVRNNGDGTFTDVTFDAGLGDVHYPSHTAAWGDYDNDGDLDLYVGNESTPALVAPSQLFRNDGDGTFTDVAGDAAVSNYRYAKAAVWGDYNGDGLQDLYVSNFGGANRLYRNTGRGSFIDEAQRLGVAGPQGSFPAWFWDFDNDGLLDLYVSAYTAGIEHLAASALGRPAGTEMSRLYRGVDGERFEEVSAAYGLTEPTAAMGSNFGDLDNDGYPDFYLGTGYPPYHSVMPNLMYRNQEGRGFSNVTYSGGFGHLQKGHGVAFADLDNDGDQDVFEQMGGAFPGDEFGNALYENPGFDNHWITVKLEGVRSNRSAIGARIRAVVVDGEGSGPRSIYRHVNSGGSFGGNPLRQTLGLGRASRIEQLDIFWPATGVTQTFTDVPADRTIHVVEGESDYATLELRTFAFSSQ